MGIFSTMFNPFSIFLKDKLKDKSDNPEKSPPFSADEVTFCPPKTIREKFDEADSIDDFIKKIDL